MFNTRFVLLATLFGSKITCVKDCVVDLPDSGSFKSYSKGDEFFISGILLLEDGLSVYLSSDSLDYDIEEPLSFVETHFSLNYPYERAKVVLG